MIIMFWTQTTEREQEIVDHNAMTTLSNNEKVEHLDWSLYPAVMTWQDMMVWYIWEWSVQRSAVDCVDWETLTPSDHYLHRDVTTSDRWQHFLILETKWSIACYGVMVISWCYINRLYPHWLQPTRPDRLVPSFSSWVGPSHFPFYIIDRPDLCLCPTSWLILLTISSEDLSVSTNHCGNVSY